MTPCTRLAAAAALLIGLTGGGRADDGPRPPHHHDGDRPHAKAADPRKQADLDRLLDELAGERVRMKKIESAIHDLTTHKDEGRRVERPSIEPRMQRRDGDRPGPQARRDGDRPRPQPRGEGRRDGDRGPGRPDARPGSDRMDGVLKQLDAMQRQLDELRRDLRGGQQRRPGNVG